MKKNIIIFIKIIILYILIMTTSIGEFILDFLVEKEKMGFLMGYLSLVCFYVFISEILFFEKFQFKTNYNKLTVILLLIFYNILFVFSGVFLLLFFLSNGYVFVSFILEDQKVVNYIFIIKSILISIVGVFILHLFFRLKMFIQNLIDKEKNNAIKYIALLTFPFFTYYIMNLL